MTVAVKACAKKKDAKSDMKASLALLAWPVRGDSFSNDEIWHVRHLPLSNQAAGV
jgi:hypothetical protein